MFEKGAAFSGFSVDDIPAAKSFYGETLDIPVTERNGMLTLHTAGGRDTLVYPKPDHVPATFTILNIRVDDVDTAVAELTARGVEFEHYEWTEANGVNRKGGPPIAWFKDPAGNTLSVIEEADPADAIAQIRALITGHADAMHAGDVDAVVGCYAPDAVSFDLRPPLNYTSSSTARAEQLTAWLAGFDGPVRVEVRDLEVETGGDVGYCRSLNGLTATPHGMPAPFTLWYRSTVGVRRVEGRWVITHEHKSTPFYMEMDDSGNFRAAVDLQP